MDVPEKSIKSFRTAAAFEKWLAANHAKAKDIFIKINRKDSGLPTVTATEALDIALCYGWIDGIRKSFDETSFLQRYSPRTKKSIWSQVNRDNIARLTAAGRMTPHGQKEVDLAKADGRWDAAYAPMRSASDATMPEDLRAAIYANPRALATYKTLGKMNLFSLAFRTNNMKTAAGRARKIESLVAMLAKGETPVPDRK